MRAEIETILARFAAGETPFAELDAIATTGAEDLEIERRLDEIIEDDRRAAALLMGDVKLLERAAEGFAPWCAEQRAKGRPESELVYGNFCRETKVTPFKRPEGER